MPGVYEPDADATADIDDLIVWAGLKHWEHTLGVRHRIERLRVVVARTSLLSASPSCFEFLDVRTVTQHYFEQPTSWFCGVDASFKPRLSKQWQPARMVDVCVCQHYTAKFAGMKRETLTEPVLGALL